MLFTAATLHWVMFALFFIICYHSFMSKELPVHFHNDMVRGYELALMANEVYDLRATKETESARAIAELLVRNPDPMQDAVLEAIDEASTARDKYTKVFEGLMDSASTLIPARHVFDSDEIQFSTEPRYSGPPGL